MRCAATVLFAVLVATSMAQGPPVYSGWQEGSALNGAFDPSRVFVFTGRVIGVDVSAPRREVEPGVAVLIRMGNGRSALVELGPLAFLRERGLMPRMGDEIDFAGSKLLAEQGSSYLASRMRRGTSEARLRTVEGRPLWLAAE